MDLSPSVEKNSRCGYLLSKEKGFSLFGERPTTFCPICVPEGNSTALLIEPDGSPVYG
jgi:hypothetical protein